MWFERSSGPVISTYEKSLRENLPLVQTNENTSGYCDMKSQYTLRTPGFGVRKHTHLSTLFFFYIRQNFLNLGGNQS